MFLGTNGWYTTPTGNTPCILIDSKDHYVVFDAGNGIYKLDQHITKSKPIYLFISHFHIDHVSGLHTLDKFTFSQGLNICFAKGRKIDFQNLVGPPYTNPTENLKMKITFHELSENSNNLPFPLSVIKLFHTYTGHGYRVSLEGKTIAYSGDCGISKGSLPLAKNADLLIHECSYLPTHPKDNWGHVGPVEAANLAKDAEVKKLILTHFDASQYTNLDIRKEAEKQAQTIFPNTIAATDDLVVAL